MLLDVIIFVSLCELPLESLTLSPGVYSEEPQSCCCLFHWLRLEEHGLSGQPLRNHLMLLLGRVEWGGEKPALSRTRYHGRRTVSVVIATQCWGGGEPGHLSRIQEDARKCQAPGGRSGRHILEFLLFLKNAACTTGRVTSTTETLANRGRGPPSCSVLIFFSCLIIDSDIWPQRFYMGSQSNKSSRSPAEVFSDAK